MNYKYCCVIDAEGFYKTLILVLLETDENGQEQEQIQYYALLDGETLIETAVPCLCLYAGKEGFVCPKWNGGNWTEGAAPDEISVWETDHPAPESEQNNPTLEERLAALEAIQLEQLLGGVVL